MSSSWSDIAAQKRKSAISKIPRDWLLPKDKIPPESERNVLSIPRTSEILTEREILITETSMADTLQHLRSGKWTSKEVAMAICKRAAIAHQLTNCLTEIFFDEGLERAKELDEYLKENGKPIGPVEETPVNIILRVVTRPSYLDQRSI
jgi:amidase